mmetsp:Transcript_31783/g.53112  ORF Transcript_31783/g.53112 Transcript_31783/m.53112 type:complete len:96 (-) Transcript_31783:17-304(-)
MQAGPLQPPPSASATTDVSATTDASATTTFVSVSLCCFTFNLDLPTLAAANLAAERDRTLSNAISKSTNFILIRISKIYCQILVASNAAELRCSR